MKNFICKKSGSLDLGYVHPVYIHAPKHRTSLRAVESSSLWPGLTGPVDVFQSPTQPETFGDGDGRSIRGSELSPRILVRKTFFSYDGRERFACPSVSLSHHACTRYADCYKHPHVVTVNLRLQNKIIVRFVALLWQRMKTSSLWREMHEYWADPFCRKICVASEKACVRFHGYILFFFFIRERGWLWRARNMRVIKRDI